MDRAPAATTPTNQPFAAFQNRSTVNDWQNPTFVYWSDNYGRTMAVKDRDTGISYNRFNGYDQVIETLDPKQQVRLFGHDVLGRLTSVTDAAGASQWIYDQGENSLGRLSETISPATPESPQGQRVRYTYEPPSIPLNRGLLQRVDHIIDGVSYPIDVDYDGLGRPQHIQYPDTGDGDPIVAGYLYDASGVLTDVLEIGSNATRPIWHLDETFQGHLIQKETFGDGSATTYGYDAQRRWLQTIETQRGANLVQSLSYSHYQNGQVRDRNEVADPSRTLHYDYDLLNRLKTVTRFTSAETETTQYAYDISGNLTVKGSTSLSYLPTQPHLIDAAGANTYVHDANGNVELRNGPDIPGGIQFIHYTPFDLPQTIRTGPSATTAFDYSADERRLVRRDRDPANPTEDRTRIFVPGLYQRELDATGATVEERFQISAGGRPIAEIIRTPSGNETLYIHSDHLGSPDTLTSGTGAIFTQAFDAFGAPDPDNAELTRSGFTGHEHDRDLGLIDMKGRIYDPLAGQFLSADPVMQVPHWSQGMNQYAYVFNDPVNGTDPSGFAAAGLDGYAVPGHLAVTVMAAHGSSSLAGLGAAGGIGALSGGTSLALGVPGMFTSTPGYSGTVTDAATVAPTTGSATQPGMADALGQNSGIQEGAQLAFDPVNFCASNPRVCTGATEVASDVGRVIRTSPKGGLTVVGALIWPSDLSDLPPARPPSLIVYRSMRSRGLLPEVGPTARTLGVRPNDLPVRDGMVSAGAHGMSVSPGSPSNLPDHRRPVQFGGRSKDPAWGFKLDDLPFGLTYVPDPENPLGHGFIAPATTMSLETYESLLESTAPSWERVF